MSDNRSDYCELVTPVKQPALPEQARWPVMTESMRPSAETN